MGVSSSELLSSSSDSSDWISSTMDRKGPSRGRGWGMGESGEDSEENTMACLLHCHERKNLMHSTRKKKNSRCISVELDRLGSLFN